MRIGFTRIRIASSGSAPRKGLSGYQTLLNAYISEGVRRDEATFGVERLERLTIALKKRGVSEKVIAEALRDIAA